MSQRFKHFAPQFIVHIENNQNNPRKALPLIHDEQSSCTHYSKIQTKNSNNKIV